MKGHLEKMGLHVKQGMIQELLTGRIQYCWSGAAWMQKRANNQSDADIYPALHLCLALGIFCSAGIDTLSE